MWGINFRGENGQKINFVVFHYCSFKSTYSKKNNRRLCTVRLPLLQKRDVPLHFIQLSDFQKHFVTTFIPLQTLWFLLSPLGPYLLRNLVVQPSPHLLAAPPLVLSQICHVPHF